MSFIHLCALLFVGLFFGGCMKGIFIPFLKKRFQPIPPFLLVLVCSFVAGLTLLSGNLFLYLAGVTIEFGGFQVLSLLSFIGISASWIFFTKPVFYWFCIWVLCFIGAFLLPSGVSFLSDPLIGVFYCFIASVFWVMFIGMMTVLDRIPLFSFLSFVALYLGGAFISADFLQTLPAAFHNPFIFSLVLFVCITYFLKKEDVFSFGKPLVFLFSYLIGFAGVCLAAMGKTIYLPVFIGYELMEITLALLINFYLYRRFVPIQVPFLAEKALMKNVLVSKVLQKIFMFCFVLASLAALCVYGSGNYVLLAYIFLVIILYNAYLNLSSWGEEKVRFRDIFKDVKAGVLALKKQMMTVPLKSDGRQEKQPLKKKSSQKGTIKKDSTVKRKPVSKSKTQKK